MEAAALAPVAVLASVTAPVHTVLDGAADEVSRVVTSAARSHILDGDRTGGGHRPGTGRPKKTEFPATWDDDRIVREIESVANDASLVEIVQANGRRRVSGMRDGIRVEVVIERDGRKIVTGYPTNVPPNP